MDLPIPLAFAIQQGISAALRFSPHTKKSLSNIDGKVIRVEVTAPALVFHVIVVDGAVEVEGGFDAEPDTTITGSAANLMSLRTSNDALYTKAVTISGDQETAQELRDILAAVDIDVEEIIAPITGDTIAHQLGQIGQQFSSWFGSTSESMKQNTSEYLQEEVELVAPNTEIKRFCSDVDEVREQLDRLTARLDVLDQSFEKSSESSSVTDPSSKQSST